MGGRVELRNFDVVISNMRQLSAEKLQQAQEAADYASVVLQEKAKEHAELADHSLEELARWHPELITDGVRVHLGYIGAYSTKMAVDSGPHPDEDVHVQGGALYANVERKVVVNGDRIIAAVGVSESAVPYVGYLINGTSKMRARDFLGHALEEVRETMKKVLIAGISVGNRARGGDVT